MKRPIFVILLNGGQAHGVPVSARFTARFPHSSSGRNITLLDQMVSFGGRSFSIWNGNTGKIVYDSKNDVDKKTNEIGTYDDKRSDDKGSEPEAVVAAKMGNQNILFVGLERSDAFMVYDATNPTSPQYLQTVKTGDAPEGILFIPASKSPTKRSLLVVSSEGDGSVKIYQPDLK